jgi:arsenate reductase (thioredoxin)
VSAPKMVLFVCIHNSARSQMAEAFVNAECAGVLRAYSAGLEAGQLNPHVVEVMHELGHDVSGKRTKSVNDEEVRSRDYDYVVTVCDETSAEMCPIIPTHGARLHWPFLDPSSFRGEPEEILERTRAVRDAIAARVHEWCATACV